jgi:hypothetical protein
MQSESTYPGRAQYDKWIEGFRPKGAGIGKSVIARQLSLVDTLHSFLNTLGENSIQRGLR